MTSKRNIDKNLIEDEYGVIYNTLDQSLVNAGKLIGVKEYSVKQGTRVIGKNSFESTQTLEKVHLPDSVEIIESSAFFECLHLKTIELNEGLVCIEPNAFSICMEITEIRFPKSLKNLSPVFMREYNRQIKFVFHPNNQYFSSDENYVYSKDNSKIIMAIETDKNKDTTISQYVLEIGDYAFYKNHSIQKVIIPDTVKILGVSSFENCLFLKEIELSKCLTSIGSCCFKNSGIENIEIPSSVKRIGKHAFSGCSSLNWFDVQSNNPYFSSNNGVLYSSDNSKLISYPAGSNRKTFTVPSEVKYIYSEAFNGAEYLTEVKLHNRILSLGSFTFSGCHNLCKIKWSKNLKRIGYGVFTYCTSLTSIILPNSISKIESGAFYFCTNLISVTLPSKLEYIGKDVFTFCGDVKLRLNRNNKKFKVFENCIYEKRIDICK